MDGDARHGDQLIFYDDTMRECRVVIVNIISLLFKYPATSGIRHVGGPVDAG